MGWPERVGGLGGSHAAARVPQRGGHRAGLVYRRHLLDARGARPVGHHVRAARAVGRDAAAAAARRRGVVPGVLRAGHRQQPRRRSRARRCAPTTAGASPARRCGRAWRSTRSAACSSRGPARRSRRTGASPRCSSTWTRRASRRSRSRRCTASPSSARCSSTTCSCPSTARSARKATAGRSPWTCCRTSAAPSLWQRAAFLHRRLQDCSTQADAEPGRSGQAGRGGAARLRVPGPVARHAAPAWRAGESLGAETSIDKVLLATVGAGGVRSRRPRRCRQRSRSATTSTAHVGAASSSTRGRRPSTAAPREIQRNIIARRLLDLGNDR